jgi:hypothetical protein
MTYQKKYYRANLEILSIENKMDFKEYHGKVFPKLVGMVFAICLK